MAVYIERGDVQFTYQYAINAVGLSEAPAAATECAAEQGYFWSYKSTVYDHFSNAGYGKGDLKNWGKSLGLNTQQFNACVDSGKYLDKVNRISSETKKAGVTGTPTFSVNGKMIVGFQQAELMQAIDQAVQQSKTK